MKMSEKWKEDIGQGCLIDILWFQIRLLSYNVNLANPGAAMSNFKVFLSNFRVGGVSIKWTRCKITALKGFLYTDGPFRAVSRTVQIFNNMGRQKSRQNFTFLWRLFPNKF